MPLDSAIDASIRGGLSGLRRALRARLVGEGLSWVVAATVGLVFVTLAFDYSLRLDRTLRAIIMGAAAAGVGWVAWREVVRPLRVPMGPAALALLVETRFGQLGDRLISAIQFAGAGSVEPLGMSDQMVAAMTQEANQIAESLDFRAIVEWARFRRVARMALSAAMLLGAFTVWQLPVMKLWFQRNVAFGQVDWPQETYLQVQGGPDFRVLRGDDLEITVAVRPGSVVPPYVLFHAQYADVGNTEERVDLDPRLDGRFVKKFRNVSEEFTFHVTGGDDRLDQRRGHRVRLVDAPALEQITFAVEPPRYTRRRPRVFDGARGALAVGPGWRVRVGGVATKDLQGARMFLDARAATRQREVRDAIDRAARQIAETDVESDALQTLLRQAAELQERIAGDLQANPPRGDACDVDRLRREVVAPLGKAADRIAKGDRNGARALLPAALRCARDGRRWLRESPLALTTAGGKRRGLKGGFTVWGSNRAEPVTLSIRMTDTEGITNRHGGRFLLQISPDTPPTVEARKRGVGVAITPNAMIPLALRIEDDMGVAAAKVFCVVEAPKSRQVGEPVEGLEPGKRQFRARHVLDLVAHQALAPKPGDRIRLWVAAEDTLPPGLGGPGAATSAQIDLRVVAAAGLLDELIRRQKELRIEFAQAIDLQVVAHGKTLDADAAIRRETNISPDVRRLLGDSGRLQTGIGAECSKAADTLASIVDEMRNNRLGHERDTDETQRNVIEPLRKLTRDVRATVTALAATAGVKDAGRLVTLTEKIATLQVNLQRAMEAILENMQKIGSRQEVDKELQRIIGLSGKLLEEIQTLVDEEIKKTFDPE